MDCIFCKIADGEIKGDIVYQDDDILLFNDIEPQAPVHILAIPKKHIATLNDLSGSDAAIIGKLIIKLKEIAAGKNELIHGYRIVSNCGREAGQSVFHIHFHMLGGRRMTWPPG